VTSGKRKRTPEPAPTGNQSVRNLVLGIDHSGRIVQHDRNAPQVLARPPGMDLLGAPLLDVVRGTGDGTDLPGRSAENAVVGLLEAIKADREGSTVLSVETTAGVRAEAVVTVRPMRAEGSAIAALATL
jgi:hypothetical protein